MADEETPETTEETAPEAPETTEEAVEAPEAEATPEPEAEPDAAPAEPVAKPTKREARAASKQAEASNRKPRSPEERQAERDEERKRKAAQRRRRRVKERAKAKETKKTPADADVAAVHAETTGRPKVRVGKVVSDKADQTITVRVEIARRHRRYEKIVRSSSTLHAHDSSNDANEGDLVRVIECRPLSKTKRWRLVEVLERAR